MRLWDTLFSSTDRLTTLLHICVAMLEVTSFLASVLNFLQLVQDTLLDRDFATSLKLLQSYPSSIDAAMILMQSDKLANEVEQQFRVVIHSTFVAFKIKVSFEIWCDTVKQLLYCLLICKFS